MFGVRNPARAQTPNTEHPTPLSFADFESGDYSDWTITGDAFGTRPATDALFPGKVKGFGGKGYASTFSPRRGVLATGRAVSRDFVIEKPVITFRIGGGNHPGKACLNSGRTQFYRLVVDGKVERTETGDGSAQLVARSWDVSALVGKTARLEIVDDTQSDRRGYVMLDDIAFGDRLQSVFLWQDRVSEPVFLNYSPVWKGVDARHNNPIETNLNLSYNTLEKLIVAVHARMSSPSLAPFAEQSVKQIADAIKLEVDSVVRNEAVSLNDFASQWVLAEAICRWVLLNVFYDKSQVGADWITGSKFIYWGKPETVLKQMPHAATCGGFATTVRDIARACGLVAYKVDGHWRGLGEVGAVPQNHSITMFVFPGNIKVPADVSTARSERQSNQSPQVLSVRPRGRVAEWDVLPIRPEAWDVFLAHFFTWHGKINDKQIVNWCGDLQGAHFFHQMPIEEWEGRNTSHLRIIEDRLRRIES